jgi:tRNA threonylcarbamoyladenosine biosynthesis protein TsaB
MPYILHIDTAFNEASVMLVKGGDVVGLIKNNLAKGHASFLHPAIQTVLSNNGLTLRDIDAVAVANGPGSYTGLRVGLAAAKGICFALNKPLICLNNLEIMAAAASKHQNDESVIYTPMIDARRMEVFTALYNSGNKIIEQPFALILDENSFSSTLQKDRMLFFGDGSIKWGKICKHPNALFSAQYDINASFATLANDAFMTNKFADLAYAEPFYLKEFHFGN